MATTGINKNAIQDHAHSPKANPKTMKSVVAMNGVRAIIFGSPSTSLRIANTGIAKNISHETAHHPVAYEKTKYATSVAITTILYPLGTSSLLSPI